METLGSWGPQGKKFVEAIGDRIALATGEKRAKYFLFQAISMATQRGNVISVMGTVPNSRKMDEIYYLWMLHLIFCFDEPVFYNEEIN